MRSEIRNVIRFCCLVSPVFDPISPAIWITSGTVPGNVGGRAVPEEKRMKTDLSVILRRLAEVRAVEGNVQTPPSDPSAGPGISRYQKRSAHLRTRDCSVDLTDFDVVDVDLTED